MKHKTSLIEVHVFRVVNSKIEFLLLQRSQTEIYPGLWQMVTGKIKNGERAYETAIREVTEETNLRIKKLWVVPNINSFYSVEEDSIYNIPVFAAQVSIKSNVRLSNEHINYKWVEASEAEKLFAWDGQKKSLNVFENYYLNKKEDFDLLEITF